MESLLYIYSIQNHLLYFETQKAQAQKTKKIGTRKSTGEGVFHYQGALCIY